MAKTDIQTDKPEKQPSQTGRATTTKKGVVSNAISLDAENPLPIELNSNIFVSLKGKRYVPFLNPVDNFGQILTEAKLLSPTTLSCVTSKAQYCAGKGIFFKEGREDKSFTDWAANVNRNQESLNEILHGSFGAKFSSGNPYVQVVRGRVAGKKFIRVYLRNYLDCRLAAPDDDDFISSVYISKYFRKIGMWNLNMMKTEEIPIYSPNMFDNSWAVDEKGFQHTIFHLKNKMSGYDYYGMPSNVGSLPNQLLEYKASRYNLDNFENNMVIGGVICVKGNMTEDEAKKTGKRLIHQHVGDGKQGRWMIMSSETGMSEGVQIESFEKEKEGSFIESDHHNEEKIYISNQWNKLLIGGSEQKSIGQGNSAYIRSVFDIANETVIIPEQNFMIEKFLKPLLNICHDWMGTSWNTYNPGLKSIQPISFLGDINVNSLLTVDEGRAIIDKDPLGGERGSAFIQPTPVKNSNPKPNDNVPD